jgi:TRAP transporter TAXI family solute receptor
VTDLRGRKVVIGVEGSSVNYIALDIFNAYDMEAGKDFEPVFDSFGASMEKLQTGEIDAAIIIAGIPTNAIVTFRSSVPLHLVSIDDEHLAKLQEDYPYFAPFTIGAEVYNTVKDAQTVALKCILAADASLSEDLVYTTTAAIFSQLDVITGAPKGSELNLASATKGVGLPFHPGAAKYYAEQGFTVNTGE